MVVVDVGSDKRLERIERAELILEFFVEKVTEREQKRKIWLSISRRRGPRRLPSCQYLLPESVPELWGSCEDLHCGPAGSGKQIRRCKHSGMHLLERENLRLVTPRLIALILVRRLVLFFSPLVSLLAPDYPSPLVFLLSFNSRILLLRGSCCGDRIGETRFRAVQ